MSLWSSVLNKTLIGNEHVEPRRGPGSSSEPLPSVLNKTLIGNEHFGHPEGGPEGGAKGSQCGLISSLQHKSRFSSRDASIRREGFLDFVDVLKNKSLSCGFLWDSVKMKKILKLGASTIISKSKPN